MDLNRRKFLTSVAATAAAAALPAVPMLELTRKYEWVDVSIGYVITRKAIDPNLYDSACGDGTLNCPTADEMPPCQRGDIHTSGMSITDRRALLDRQLEVVAKAYSARLRSPAPFRCA